MTRGLLDERDAFIVVMTYCFRRSAEPDQCASCGPLPLGSSFPEHQWNVFVKLRGTHADA